MTWGTPVELERRRRIRLAVWAYAYEYRNESLVSDAEFDREAVLVDLTIDTGNPKMDAWFRKEFSPSTGMWVRKHPAKGRLSDLWRRYRQHRSTQ